jgi:hypothetical protein
MTVTFTLTQVPTEQNLYLYPDGTYHSGCTASPVVLHNLNVDDEYDIPDDDTTFNWMQGPSVVTDLYTMQNHSSETGTINYVKVFARVKAHQFNLASTGYFRMLAYHSGTTARETKTLTTDYNTYSYLLTSTPSGGAWNWTAIDNLRIGFDAYSPVVSAGNTNLALRPSGDDTINLYVIGTTDHYDAVNEDVYDTSDYVYWVRPGTPYTWNYDLYSLEDHTTEAGTINYIRACGWFKPSAYWSGCGASVRFGLRTLLSAVSYSADVCTGGSPYYYTATWDHNYDTGVAWTWAEVDDLVCGPSLNGNTYNVKAECLQMYLIVNYDALISPQVRVTSMYAIVNYTPSSGACHLLKPVTYSYTNNRKITKINTWNNERKVYDVNRISKTLVMNGVEYLRDGIDPEDRLEDVRAMKDNGVKVTISGIGDTLVDTDWLIESFTYQKNLDNPQLYEWVMTLERYEND